MPHRNEYGPGQLATLAGVSVRTLHHYESMGILHPERAENGYRIFGPEDVDRLQLALLYRNAGIPLSGISAMLDDPQRDIAADLRGQCDRLREQRQRLDDVIETVEKTISSVEERKTMEDKEKFKGLKKGMIARNERLHGSEARAAYGDEAIDASNEKLLNMTQESFASAKEWEREIENGLRAAIAEGYGASSPEMQRVCDLHRRWICAFWQTGAYSKQAHAGLAQMYLADDRFRSYYERMAPGAAQLLHDALEIYCKEDRLVSPEAPPAV